jgi:NADPH:quinone reductase-like Zn-dependent oxidoreductase
MPKPLMMMRAAIIHAFGPPDVLQAGQVPAPVPLAGEVLVRTIAAGVNAIDWKTRAGYGVPVPAFPATLGWDIAGTVVMSAPDVTTLAAGDLVFGMPRFPSLAGGYAEYVTAPADQLALVPPAVDVHVAASIPMVAITAWQTLYEHARLQAGQRVLIHGAAGGVGHVAVQLAKETGAEVAGTASARNREFLLGLGADQVLSYDNDRLEGMGRQFDVAVDTRGGEEFMRLLSVVRPGGIIVSLLGRNADYERMAAERNVRTGFTYVAPDGKILAEIAGLIRAGRLRTAIAQALPLERAAEAHALGEQGHVRGRLVLDISR